MVSFLCVLFAKSQKMDSNKVEAVSKRSQANIFIKQGYSVRVTAQLIKKLSFFVQEWSKRGENGTFERRNAAKDLLKFQVKF